MNDPITLEECIQIVAYLAKASEFAPIPLSEHQRCQQGHRRVDRFLQSIAEAEAGDTPEPGAEG